MNNFNPIPGKIIAFLLFLGLYLSQIPVQAQTTEDVEEQEVVTFYPVSVEKALTELKQINKPLFVYIYTRFTPECTRMKKTVFTQPEVAALLNDRFFPLAIELQSEEGMTLRNKYTLTNYTLAQYPILLFLSPAGEVLNIDNGFKNPADLTTLANKVLSITEQQPANMKFEPASTGYKEFFDYLRQYQNGNKQPDFLYDLAYLMREYNEMYKGVVEDFLTLVGPQNYLTPKNSRFILDFADNVHSMAYTILTTNRNFFVSQFSKEEVDNCIEKAVREFVITSANTNKNNTEADLKKISDIILLSGFSKNNNFEFQMQLLYFAKSEKWEDYARTAITTIGIGKNQNPDMLNNIAWQFVQHISQPDMLEKAQLWILEATKQKTANFVYQETYTALLYKAGKTEKAMKEADKAIELARQQGHDYTSTLELIECVRRNKPIPTDLRDEY